jgi:hypothetical protein
MRTLCAERFAPTTSSIGFLELSLEKAAEELATWRRSLYPSVSLTPVTGELPMLVVHLEPLTGGSRPRELLVEAGPRWTAYFDCSVRGTDAVSTIGHLSRTVRCQGVAIRSVPHIAASGSRPARLGAVQFELFGPLRTEFLNYVRTVSVAFSGSKWQFNATGTEQAFEEPAMYQSHRVRDRFTSEMLGIDPFVAESYGPNGVLVESAMPPASGGHVMSIADTQRWLGIEPSVATELPG